MTRTYFKKRAAALAVASCLSLTPWLADAASLGKITVLSGLGQPLRAEIDLSATRAELTNMNARLAATTAYREAGIDYAPVLLDLRFAIDKRANGTPVIKVSSAKPINEPFIDVLVELSWPSGPLLREYTFLLDPPEVAAKAARQAAVVEARVVPAGATATNGSAANGAAAEVAAPRAAASAKKPAEASTHLIEKGETLRKIAGETKYEGVTLEQMLVGLYRRNPSAFVGENINRMKAGAILNIPDKATVAAIPAAEAKQVYVTQTGDWNAYRQKLAAATAQAKPGPDEAAQSATGKITAKVEDKPSAVDQAKDQVKVSRTEMAGKGAAGGKPGKAEEELVAKDQALKEAEARVALLEKNVSELQKLVDLKTQLLAELQQQAAARKDGAPAPAPVAAKAPEPAPAPAPVVAEPPKPVEAAKPVEPPKAPEESKVAAPPPPPVAPAEPPKAPEVKKAEAPAKPAAAPVAESGMVDQLLADPLPLLGGGGIIALLVGYLLLKRRRSEPEPELASALPETSSVGGNSVFRMTGGQSVDTANVPLANGEFSQMGLAAIDTDEVDPVAEADVYMAYGRDAQAEEILIEALRKDPQRTATHVKLFEIYAKNRSVKQFDTLASEFYAQTGGVGAEWEKVAAMGAALDPDNPLYSDGRGAPAGVSAAPGRSAPAATSADNLDQFSGVAAAAMTAALVADQPKAEELPAVAEAVSEELGDTSEMALDFDLGGGDKQVAAEAEVPAIDVIDFDLGGAPTEAAVPATPQPEVGEERDFTETLVSFAGPDGLLNEASPAVDAATTAAGEPDSLVGDLADFTVDFEIADVQSPAAAQPAVDEPALPVPEFDLSTINLDLGAGLGESVAPPAPPDNQSSGSSYSLSSGEDVSTKLALAKAYDEMGDQDQARELLREVIAEGSADLADEARAILARLGA